MPTTTTTTLCFVFQQLEASGTHVAGSSTAALVGGTPQVNIGFSHDFILVYIFIYKF